jgi:uncharacterized protein YciI
MYALVLIRYRAPIEAIEAATADHRTYLRSLQASGVLLASGPLDPRTGGAVLLRLPDDAPPSALDAIRDGDPYWQRGLANYELLRWNVGTGRETLDAI